MRLSQNFINGMENRFHFELDLRSRISCDKLDEMGTDN